MTELQRHPDSALLSAETVHDFQLSPGDRVRLRLRDARSGQLQEVAFRFAGVVTEFPTAPRDSFIVANASYLSARTHDAGIPVALIGVRGAPPAGVARRVRRAVGPSVRVTDIDTTRQAVGSSLTSVDLRGLTKVELGFAVVLAAAAAGLLSALGLAERRRSLAITVALGARPRQLGAFVWSEATVVAAAGALTGLLAGWALAFMLTKVLTGVFDPPPPHLHLPWLYVGSVAALAAAGIVVATWTAARGAGRDVIRSLREL
jgi:putative ABC transport system permease protein